MLGKPKKKPRPRCSQGRMEMIRIVKKQIQRQRNKLRSNFWHENQQVTRRSSSLHLTMKTRSLAMMVTIRERRQMTSKKSSRRLKTKERKTIQRLIKLRVMETKKLLKLLQLQQQRTPVLKIIKPLQHLRLRSRRKMTTNLRLPSDTLETLC
jgi:hypothetical protein